MKQWSKTETKLHCSYDRGCLSFMTHFCSPLQIDSENSGVDEEREGRLFPEPNSDTRIQCHDMTNEFLIYGTDVSMGINEFTLQNGNID